MRYIPRWLLLVFLTAALVGCESSIEAPDPTAEDLPDQARTATTLLPPDGRMMAMVDLQQMRTHGPSALREAFSKVSNPSVGDHGELHDFLTESGLDLSTDIERVYLTQPREDRQQPYLVLTGTFDRERIGQALEAQAGRDVRQVDVSGTSAFLLRTDNQTDVAISVVREDLLAIAPSAHALEAMLHRSVEGMATTDDMLLRAASQGQSAWYVLRNLNAPASSNAPDEMERLGSALQDMAGSFTFTDGGALDGALTLVPKGNASPEDVADVVRGLVAAAKQSADISADAREALQRTDVQATDADVRITAHLPAPLINQLANQK